MEVKDYLEAQIKRLAEQAKSITRLAEDEGRELTEEERSTIDSAMEQIPSLKAEIAKIDDRKKLQDAIEAAAHVAPVTEAPSEPKTIGDAFVKSDAYKGWRASGGARTSSWSTGQIHFGQKLSDAGLSVEGTDMASGNLPLAPQVGPIVGPAEQPLTIADLFGQGQATSNSIVYLEETTTTAGAYTTSPYEASNLPATPVTTSEGAAKPAAFIDFTRRSIGIDKIAAFLPVSEELLEDEPAIASYINTRLSTFIRQAEEAYLYDALTGAGIGTSDSSDISGDNLFDAIAAGIMAVQTEGGLAADALLIHPTDFWTLAVTKDGVNGGYFSGGPYAAASRNPWGLRSVVTAAVDAGAPIVGAFREGATVWRKGGLSVEASNSHSDYFRKNLVAIRAEERLGLAVYRPDAFQVLSVTT